MRLHPAAGFLMFAAILAACAENPTVAGRAGPVSVVIAGGNAQVGVAGQELPVALKVRVLADNGRPRGGFLVNFRITKGSGRMYAGSSVSDRDGYAQDYWTLGSELFTTQQVDVVAVDPTTGAKLNYGSFTATGASSPNANLVITPTTTDLGSATVSTTGTTASFTVTNTGATTSGTIATNLGGGNAGDFQLGANACAGATLAMGATCQVSVQFAPITVGSLAATLSASASPGGTATANLQGLSLGVPALAISPTTHAFGQVAVGSASANQVFTVSNGGSAPSGPLGTSFSGTNPTQFQVVSSTCTGSLAAGASCTVIAKYQPTALGGHTASLDVTGTPGGTVSAAVSGSAVPPAQLEISPASVSFGAVVPQSTIITLPFTVTNTGGSLSGVPALQISGGSGAFTIVGSSCTAALAPGAACSVSVRFQAPGMGTFTAFLAVSGNPGGTDQSALTGYGVSSPLLAFSPTSAGFGSVAIGQVSSYQQINVLAYANTGPMAVSIVGANPTDFTIGAASTCLNASLTGGSQSCYVLVRFEPQATGGRAASLQVVSSQPGGGSGLVPLTGTSVTGPILSIAPAGFNFGSLGVGAYSAYTTFFVTNSGNASSGAVTAALAGSNPGDFEIGNNTCAGASLLPGQGCLVAVRFTPGAEGARTAALQVTGALGGTGSATLAGSGAPASPAILQVTPATGDFGVVTVGSSANLDFTISNVGGATISMGPSVSGTDFSIFGSTCTGSLTAGQSCVVTVQFRPRVPGGSSGSLVVNSALPPVTVPLTGSGG